LSWPANRSHPSQLRKLVQARKPGDKKLAFTAPQETDGVPRWKAPARYGLFDDGGKLGENLRALELDLRGCLTLPLHAQAKALNECSAISRAWPK
jgi:hypothetical protein